MNYKQKQLIFLLFLIGQWPYVQAQVFYLVNTGDSLFAPLPELVYYHSPHLGVTDDICAESDSIRFLDYQETDIEVNSFPNGNFIFIESVGGINFAPRFEKIIPFISYANSDFEELGVMADNQFTIWDGTFAFTALSERKLLFATDSLILGIIDANPDHNFPPYNALFYQRRFTGLLPDSLKYPNALGRRGDDILIATNTGIYNLDTINLEQSQLIVRLPTTLSPIESFTTLTYECGQKVTYAIINRGTRLGVDIYEVDVDRGQLVRICGFDNKRIMSISSPQEYDTLACDILVDLDGPSTSRIDFEAPSSCDYERNLLDSIVHLYASQAVDSLVIELRGMQDAEEVLSVQLPTGIRLNRISDQYLQLINEQGVDVKTFEATLKQIVYQNNTASPTPGRRRARVTLYAGDLVSETATVTFEVGVSEDLQLAASITDASCFDSSDGQINLTAQGGIAPYRFEWLDTVPMAERTGLAAGRYPVRLVDSLNCVYTDTLQVGSPNAITLQLTTRLDTICGNGGSISSTVSGGTGSFTYEWNTGAQIADLENVPAGTYELIVRDANDCSALASYTLFNAPPIQEDRSATLCQGEAYDYNGLSLSRDTAFCDTLTTTAGCDSIFCLNLNFLPTAQTNTVASICEGGTYDFNGQILTQDTAICTVLTAANGCDSTICLDLRVIPTISTQEEITICRGESYTFQGQILQSDTTICTTTVASTGCDSTHCFTLRTRVPSSSSSLNICQGDTLNWQNQVITNAGTYQSVITSATGCDSMLNLTVTYHPNATVSITQVGSLCAGDEVLLSASGYSEYSWSNGKTSSQLAVNQAGTYGLSVTDQNGCQATDEIILTEIGIQEIFWTTTDPSCHDLQDGIFRIDSIQGGMGPFVLSLNGAPFSTSLSKDDLAGGNYSVLIEDINGCRKTTAFELLTPQEPILMIAQDLSINLGDSIILSFEHNFQPNQIKWSPADDLSCDTCPNPVASPIETTVYDLLAKDANDCEATARTIVTVQKTTQIYIPNTFSPNGDGINDELVPFGGPSIASIKRFQIVDRWGNLIYERRNFQPGTNGWDGRYQGEEVASDVYLYRLEVERVDSRVELVVGEVLVLR